MFHKSSLLKYGLAFLLISAFYISCDKTEGGGSGSLEPGSGDAEIIEGFICSHVADNKPEGIDNSFYPDELVYLWMQWGNVSGSHTVKVYWVNPDDKVMSEQEEKFNSTSGKAITHFFIDTTSSAPIGRWLAEVHIDGHFIRSYAFWMNES